MSTMASELIVNFPTHRDRPIDTSEMYIVDRNQDNQDVDRRNLWYNE